jgi:hypothetical protein
VPAHPTRTVNRYVCRGPRPTWRRIRTSRIEEAAPKAQAIHCSHDAPLASGVLHIWPADDGVPPPSYPMCAARIQDAAGEGHRACAYYEGTTRDACIRRSSLRPIARHSRPKRLVMDDRSQVDVGNDAPVRGRWLGVDAFGRGSSTSMSRASAIQAWPSPRRKLITLRLLSWELVDGHTSPTPYAWIPMMRPRRPMLVHHMAAT